MILNALLLFIFCIFFLKRVKDIWRRHARGKRLALDAWCALRAWREQAGIGSAEVACRKGFARGVSNRIEMDHGR